ncbi:hypothetical protein ONZ45_g7940 [Pleurotus djamor]|nr:hypothetical protein ONZ45_g7940 [Pleurotus djamor]
MSHRHKACQPKAFRKGQSVGFLPNYSKDRALLLIAVRKVPYMRQHNLRRLRGFGFVQPWVLLVSLTVLAMFQHRLPFISARQSLVLQQPQATPISARIDYSADFLAQYSPSNHPSCTFQRTEEGRSNRRRGLQAQTSRPSIIEEEQDTDNSDEAEAEAEGSDDEPERIKKPAGECGRPGSGGYSLEETLTALDGRRWGKRFLTITQAVHDEANKTLDTGKCYRDQDKVKVNDLCAKIVARWPFLDNYAAHWPIRDMLKAHLKYTVDRTKRVKLRQDHERMKAVVQS